MLSRDLVQGSKGALGGGCGVGGFDCLSSFSLPTNLLKWKEYDLNTWSIPMTTDHNSNLINRFCILIIWSNFVQSFYI